LEVSFVKLFYTFSMTFDEGYNPLVTLQGGFLPNSSFPKILLSGAEATLDPGGRLCSGPGWTRSKS
jgi:hypothetical protein